MSTTVGVSIYMLAHTFND